MEWKLTEPININRIIDLVHENDFKNIPDGTELVCIDGTKVIKGKDYIDNDTRGGYLAYGIERK